MRFKIYVLLFAVVCCISACTLTDEPEGEIHIDGLYYRLDTRCNTAEVSGKCSHLTHSTNNIIIPASVEFNGKTYSVTGIGKGAFKRCSSLTSITIGNNVTLIEEDAFRYCRNLISVIIGNSVVSIGSGAFIECSSLASVTCKTITPPATNMNLVFGDLPKLNNIPLYVPTESVEIYKKTYPWNDFKPILAIEETSFLCTHK